MRSTGDLGAHQGPLVEPILAAPHRIVVYVAELVAYRVSYLVLPPGALEVVQAAGPTALAVVAAVVLGGLVWGAVAGGVARVVLVLLALTGGSLLLATLGRLVLVHGPVTSFSGRYALHPFALVLLAAVVVVDHLEPARDPDESGVHAHPLRAGGGRPGSVNGLSRAEVAW